MSVEHFAALRAAEDKAGPFGPPFFGRFPQHRIDLTVKLADLMS